MPTFVFKLSKSLDLISLRLQFLVHLKLIDSDPFLNINLLPLFKWLSLPSEHPVVDGLSVWIFPLHLELTQSGCSPESQTLFLALLIDFLTGETSMKIGWLSCHTHLESSIFPVSLVKLVGCIPGGGDGALWSLLAHHCDWSLAKLSFLSRVSLLESALYSVLVCIMSCLKLSDWLILATFNQLGSCADSHGWFTPFRFVHCNLDMVQGSEVFSYQHLATLLNYSYFALCGFLDGRWVWLSLIVTVNGFVSVLLLELGFEIDAIEILLVSKRHHARPHPL